ncbi:FAD-dependent monooxygenase [Spiractinospora alimapuensis]|uniref:FAD-dependent monooxygenase n=1 Tax=Spiractinospora alimapuensis TaxID=2820884 RepID=UPI001F2962A9|nr:FAD-dependent monooxygenase [Spiractinospora alimapuensis]QVQ51565.1 FAD-dependent monooxygenase [Spiractinospora alimapuensis]
MTTDVVIVGAGPTGLTLGIELARRGVGVRVVDASSGVTTQTRALGVQARTLELLRRVDLAEPAIDLGLTVTDFRVFSERHQILHLTLRDVDSPYPFLLMLPQNQTEELLSTRLADAGVVVERDVELVDLHQTVDAAHATLRHRDGTVEETSAAWVVGCDGARSSVRRLLKIPFVGSTFEENFAVADLRMDWALPNDELFAFLHRGDFIAFFPMADGLHRVATAQGIGDTTSGEVTRAELEAAVERGAPSGSRIAEIREAGRFQINQRSVARHAQGRVFLAGDAAHIHSVVGAQGMNTGIHDAFNLGWKLAAVIRGNAARTLLDTYATERAPVARRLVRGTRRITRMTLLRNPVSTAARRTIASRVLGRPTVQRTLARALTQVDVSYRDSTGAAHDDSVRAGDRAPDVGLTSDTSLFDVLDSTFHTLLVVGNISGATGSALRALVDASGYPTRVVHVLDADGSSTSHADIVIRAPDPLRHRYDIDDHASLLIRPDGYIAWRGMPDDHVGLSQVLANNRENLET